MKKLVFFIVLFWGLSQMTAQAQSLDITNYTTANGLAENICKAVVVDNSGNVWFGSFTSGITKFDGVNWYTYNTINGLPSNNVNSICLDLAGNIWVGTSNGASKFNGSTWTTYKIANGLIGNNINKIFCDVYGNVWFGTTQGVSKYNGTSFINYTTVNGLVNNDVTSITRDYTGNYWFGTNGSGLSKYDGTTWTTFNTSSGLPDNTIRALAVDEWNRVWIGTVWNGVSCYNYGTFTNYPMITVNDIQLDGYARIWFATNGGVVVYNCFQDTWNYISTYNSNLIDNIVQSIAIQYPYAKWFGTQSGVSKGTDKANAGADKIACSDTVLLEAEPSIGMWSIISGSGTIVSLTDHRTMVRDLVPGETKFSWQLYNSSVDTLIVNYPLVSAYAGADTIIGQDHYQLHANHYDFAWGNWYAYGQGTINNTTGWNAMVYDLVPNQTHIFNWTLHYGNNYECYKSDDVTVTYVPAITANINIPTIDTIFHQFFEIPILTNTPISTQNIIAYQFDLKYDTTLIEYTGYELNGTLSSGGQIEVNQHYTNWGELVLSVGYINTAPLAFPGTLIKLKFWGKKIGTSSIQLTDFLYNSTKIYNLSSGTVNLHADPAPTAYLTYSYNPLIYHSKDTFTVYAHFNEPIMDSPVPQIALEQWGYQYIPQTNMQKISNTLYKLYVTLPQVWDWTYNMKLYSCQDFAGNPIIPDPTSGGLLTIKQLVYGDVDANDYVQAYDAALTLQYSVGLDPIPTIDPLPWEFWRLNTANVDGISNISAYDASLILKYALGIITQFPAETMKGTSPKSADVNVTVENGFIVFRSSGDLFGLNVFVNENIEYLGTPQIINTNMISSTNITTTSYALGLATAYAPASNEIFMKIPYTTTNYENVTFDMIVNNETKSVTVGLITGVVEINENVFVVYPNPANTTLYISGLQQNTKISIFDLSGKMLVNKQVADNQIDISSFQSGIYTMQIETAKGIVTKKFVKQ